MPIRVAIVPHTHWDREWYSPFQTFRMRLVKLLDALLPLLENDLSYSRFLLDGQTAVIDDYLEIRPEAAPRLARLAAAGRLSVGPWMVLMDEFMVSGETMVRDLQLGIRRGAELGGVMEVGYLPDMFGHVAQMPQMLRLGGFEHTVVWRGVPESVEHDAFWWEAPDGSRVRAEYLYGSYSNGRMLPDDAKRLVGRARDYEQELGSARLGAMLLMNGTDHEMPQPWLGRVVAEANAMQDEYEFVVTSLPEHLADRPVEGITTVRGELRSGARANLLMGVGSNRVDVHRACAVAERTLERLAEPLSALLLPAAEYPHALAEHAWRKLVLNSAHDSSCACSHDDVVDHVLVRYAEARHIAEGLARDAVHRLARTVTAPLGSTLVVNPTMRARGGLVEVTVPGTGPCTMVGPDGADRPTQVLAEAGGEGPPIMVAGQKVRWVCDEMQNGAFQGRPISAYEVDDTGSEVVVTMREAGPGEPRCDLDDLKAVMLGHGSAERTLRIRYVETVRRTVLFDAGEIAGFGWSCFTAREGAGPSGPVRDFANEHLSFAIDAETGTFAIATADGIEVSGLGRLVDGGDGGDTYNYSPPASDRIIDRPDAVAVETLETGPVRARARITADYTLPAAAVGDERSCSARTDDTVAVRISTTLELRAGEPFLRVAHDIDNRARDHRLRAHFPLPATVTGSAAECAFTVVERGLTAEGGLHEYPLPTFPSRRFVDVADGNVGLALLHDGLLEYEVVDGGRELALTLLRANGYLSRSEPDLRPNPAGPLDPLEGPQLLGRQRAEYAVMPHRGDWRSADCYGAADAFTVPLPRTRTVPTGPATQPAVGHALRVEGAEVSAVHRVPGGLIVRAFRTEPTSGPVTIEHEGAPGHGHVIDFRGRPLARFEGTLDARPWEIVTVQLSD